VPLSFTDVQSVNIHGEIMVAENPIRQVDRLNFDSVPAHPMVDLITQLYRNQL
jgi:hypothetical protein